jgi:hypothetical protein
MSRNSSLTVGALVAGIGLFTAAPAAADPIATDRPDFVESSDVVGAGRFQLETGVSFEKDRQGGVVSRLRTTPTLLRVGVSETLELRVETDGFGRERTRDAGVRSSASGYSDASLGLKWHMQDGDESTGRPGVAWLLHADVDSGSKTFRGQGVRPSLRAVAEWELPYDASVGVMGGVALDRREDNHRFAAGILAVTVGKSWTPQWRTFIELAGQQLASRRNGGSVLTFDAGVTYLVTDSIQLDLSASRGLNDTTPDTQWGLGFSIRF